MIPQAAPAARIARFRDKIDKAVGRVLESPTYILGSALEQFEAAFASYIGVAHCVGVNSGTDAIALCLRALGVRPGGEVITSALTAAGTVQAILHCGAIPVFADVDEITRCIDPAAVAAAVTGRTVAIVPVHLFGQPCEMGALVQIAERHALVIVEDCAQAHGANIGNRKLGSFGHAAAFSFYPTKNLGCVGDGGAVLTNDAKVVTHVRSQRNYGFRSNSQISEMIGFNSRLDDIQAAILNELLPFLDANNDERRSIAARYRRLLENSDVRLPLDDTGCVYHQFALTYKDRDELMRHLAEAGIGTKVHYTPGLHRHPVFSHLPIPSLPVTDTLANTLLSLPVQPEVSVDVVERVAEVIAKYVQR
jgi:dTDP-4-amino-4,6-dideoxygalactose transaminase